MIHDPKRLQPPNRPAGTGFVQRVRSGSCLCKSVSTVRMKRSASGCSTNHEVCSVIMIDPRCWFGVLRFLFVVALWTKVRKPWQDHCIAGPGFKMQDSSRFAVQDIDWLSVARDRIRPQANVPEITPPPQPRRSPPRSSSAQVSFCSPTLIPCLQATTMLLGIGIDILSITRFQALLARRPGYTTQLAKRICSPGEYRQFESEIKSGDVFRFLSARYVSSSANDPRVCLCCAYGSTRSYTVADPRVRAK